MKRLLNLFRGRHLNTDIERELAFHLAEQEDALVESGMPRPLARREARRRFGHPPLHRERTRDVDVMPWLDGVLRDVRYAVRSLRWSKAFTTVAVLSLALGIGANTAIFSLINAVMLRALPVVAPEELVVLTMSADDDHATFTNPLWEQFRDQQDVFAGVVAFGETQFNLADAGEERPVSALWVSGSFFPTLGVTAGRGRLPGPADDVRGCPPTAVVSDAFWRGELGSDPQVVGRTLRLNGTPFEILGVAARGFQGMETGRGAAVFVPLCTAQAFRPPQPFLDHRSWWFLTVLGRLRADVPLTQVNERLSTLSGAWFANTVPSGWSAENTADYLARRFVARPTLESLSGLRTTYASALLALMAIVGLVLLIACANVASLMLARAASRQREVAVRVALGASRGRVARQLLTEGLLLSTAGAAVGIVLARGMSRLLVLMMSSRDAVVLDLGVDAPVLIFTALVAVGTAILFGVAPAWQAGRVDPQRAMQAGGRGVVGSPRLGVRKVLVTFQVALALILVTGAGLLLGSFRALRDVEAGFDAEQVLVVSANLRLSGGQASTARQQIIERLRTMPGVVHAAASFNTPLSRMSWNDLVDIPGKTFPRSQDAEVYLNEVTDGYFAALGMRRIAGRDFGAQDVVGAPLVAIVNETAVRRFFDGANPIGRTFRLKRGDGNTPPIEVVGVVGDAKYQSLRETTLPTAFFPLGQDSAARSQVSLVVKGSGAMTALRPAITRLVAEVSPRATVRFQALERQVADTMVPERLLAVLSGFFGALALLLAMIGLYGTMAYQVARRRGEIGIRLALGAARGRVLRGVMTEVGQVLVAGLLLGAVGVLAATPLVERFLFAVTSRDPWILGGSALVLSATAALAGYLPARRAARMDPMQALRQD